MILRLTRPLPANGVCIVESHQSLAISSMQRKRVIQSVRFLRRDRYQINHKANAVSSFGVDDEREVVQIKERIKGGIALMHASFMLSVHHNRCNQSRFLLCIGKGAPGCKPFC